VSGVGLGDRVAQVTLKFGRAPAAGVASPSIPLDDDGSSSGPQLLPILRREKDLRYPKLFFAAENRVRYLAVADKQARLSRGVGPGDSISLVRRAYPELKCGEETTGADADIFYPACYGKLAPGMYAYVNGDYTRPGVPVIDIWLGDFDLAAGKTGHLKPLRP